MAARHQLVLRGHLFDLAYSVGPDHILHYNDITRLGDSKIRFGGDDERERLEVGRHLEFALVARIEDEFADVG